MLDSVAIGREFPALGARTYLDNAATTLQPRCVIDAVSGFYETARSPDDTYRLYDDARRRVASCVGSTAEEVAFCASATHAIDLIAQSWGAANVGAGDEIVVSSAEHVANLACWQALAKRSAAQLRVVRVDDSGAFPLDAFKQTLSKRTKLVAVTHVSNVTGAIFPVRDIIAITHDAGASVLIDGAQAVCRLPIGFDELDADFYAFSGHKAFTPTGIGVLLGKSELLNAMHPILRGANAFEVFTLDESKLAPIPGRFEGGSANIAGAIGLARALEFVAQVGWIEIADHELKLCERLDAGLAAIKGLSVLGSNARAAIRSFTVEGCDSADIQKQLNARAIDIRAGHLSAQTLLRQFGVENALRVSAAIYNDENDIDRFVHALAEIVR